MSILDATGTLSSAALAQEIAYHHLLIFLKVITTVELFN
jgi:hypothetical protein